MSRAIMKCIAIVEKQCGGIQVRKVNLKTKLPFGLEEMEKWITEKEKPRKVKCYYPRTDIVKAMINFLQKESQNER